MEISKRIVLLVLKTAVVLFIPYFWSFDSSSTLSSFTIIGTWGILFQGSHSTYTDDSAAIWMQNQILYSFLFILPLLLFSLLFGDKEVSRDSIIAAVVSVFTSFIILDILTPRSYFISPISQEVVPNVISLAIFVFVFWPIIRNSWPVLQREASAENEQGFRSRIRRVRSDIFHFDLAIFTWIGMVVLPAIFSLSVYIVPDMQTQINFQFAGGLAGLYYSYTSVAFSGSIHPIINTSLILTTALSASIFSLPIWSLNLVLGVTTFRYILGKSTKKRVYALVALSILIFAIPSVLFMITSILFGIGGYSIPLPLYPIIMLFAAKFGKPPSQKEPLSEDMIRVPLRTRISSML